MKCQRVAVIDTLTEANLPPRARGPGFQTPPLRGDFPCQSRAGPHCPRAGIGSTNAESWVDDRGTCGYGRFQVVQQFILQEHPAPQASPGDTRIESLMVAVEPVYPSGTSLAVVSHADSASVRIAMETLVKTFVIPTPCSRLVKYPRAGPLTHLLAFA